MEQAVARLSPTGDTIPEITRRINAGMRGLREAMREAGEEAMRAMRGFATLAQPLAEAQEIQRRSAALAHLKLARIMATWDPTIQVQVCHNRVVVKRVGGWT